MMNKNNIVFKPLVFINTYKADNYEKYDAETPFGHYSIMCMLDDTIEYKIFDVFGNDISPESLLSFEMAEKICGEHFKDLLRRCVGGVKVEPCNECSDRSWLVAENRDIRRDIYGWK